MIKLKVNNLDKDNEEKNIVKVNLTPDIIMLKEALEYFDTNQYKLEDINNKIKYIDDTNPIIYSDHNYILPFINTSNINEFKYNKIKADIYNDNDNRPSAILNKMFNFIINHIILLLISSTY